MKGRVRSFKNSNCATCDGAVNCVNHVAASNNGIWRVCVIGKVAINVKWTSSWVKISNVAIFRSLHEECCVITPSECERSWEVARRESLYRSPSAITVLKPSCISLICVDVETSLTRLLDGTDCYIIGWCRRTDNFCVTT